MELQSVDDVLLMREVKAGKKEAFAALVRRHQQSLLNFFRRMGACMEDAEDMVQETFLRLFDYRMRYEPSAKFTTFLYTLARNTRADWLRKLQREERISVEFPIRNPELSFGLLEHREWRIDIQTALEELSPKLRVVVVMSVYQGLPYREIAEILEIPLGTVKSRMHLAVRQLREALSVHV